MDATKEKYEEVYANQTEQKNNVSILDSNITYLVCWDSQEEAVKEGADWILASKEIWCPHIWKNSD